MARNDSFRVRWASNPAQFERPQTSLIERGWAGGANEDPPEAKWENWWHNRVDEALAEVEANGALNWQPDVPYEVGATVRDDGVNWICAIPNNDIRPSGGANDGHWLKLAAQATESEFGAVRLADAATAQGLTDALRVLTPATLGAAMNAHVLGMGQTWQDVKAQRAFDTTYTNTTGRPILVAVALQALGSSGTDNHFHFFVDDVLVGNVRIAPYGTDTSLGARASVYAIVPAGSSYRVDRIIGDGAIPYWSELR